jgi:peptidoglycan/LPS O-acetylase OafA/YrhL
MLRARMTHAPEPRAGETPDALKPPPGNPRFPLMDSMRAIAALCVVVTHASGLTAFNSENPLGAVTARLNVGVTVFFLISGFLLYRPFVRAAYHGLQPPRIGRFFRRRALRIVPAYWLALTVLAIWPGLAGVFTGNWWAYYGFAQIYSDEYILGGIGPAWSLCIEVTFYLVLPFYAMAMARAYATKTRARAVEIELYALAALAGASVLARTVVHLADDQVTYPSTLPGTFTWFALGMALAVTSVALEGDEDRVAAVRLVVRRPWVPWALALLTLVLLAWACDLPRSFPADTGELSFLAEYVLFGLFAFFLLLPAVFGDDRGGWPRRVLANPVLAWLGLISYGLYLWHVSLMIWLEEQGVPDWLGDLGFPTLLVVTLAFAVSCAAASYYLVEKPLLRFKDPRRPRPPAATSQPEPAPSAG